MIKKKTNRILERDKQLLPLKGEVTLDNARAKAALFASQVKLRLKRQGAKL